MKGTLLTLGAIALLMAGLMALATWDMTVFAVALIGTCLGLLLGSNVRHRREREAARVQYSVAVEL